MTPSVRPVFIAAAGGAASGCLGRETTGNTMLSDLWTLRGLQGDGPLRWTKLSFKGQPPSARGAHAIAGENLSPPVFTPALPAPLGAPLDLCDAHSLLCLYVIRHGHQARSFWRPRRGRVHPAAQCVLRRHPCLGPGARVWAAVSQRRDDFCCMMDCCFPFSRAFHTLTALPWSPACLAHSMAGRRF